MVNLVTYFHGNFLPSREVWEKVSAAQKIPLCFSSTFEPRNHPVCGYAQDNHPNGLVTVKLGEATCQFQLDIHRLSSDTNCLAKYYDSHTFENFDSTATFRWSEFNGANALSAQLAAATLALAANGMVLWDRAEKGFYIGEEAFRAISRSAFNGAQKKAGQNYKFSKKDLCGPVMKAEKTDNGWAACPRCGKKFKITSTDHWDGEKHSTCGQLIVFS